MKRIMAVLLATIMMLSSLSLFSACGSKKPNAEGNAEAEKKSEWTAVTVKDQSGREVTIEQQPQRIVSGYYISTLACITLGLTDKMVGIESKASSRPIYSLAAPDLIAKDGCGNKKGLDMEKVTSLKPDLVILAKSQKDSVDALKQMGIPCIVVSPESHENLVEMIELIGKATGHSQQAKKLADYYDKSIKNVSALAGKVKEAPSVLFCGTDKYLTCAPDGTYQSAMITTAGGTNAAKDVQGSGYTEISYEQLIAMNPDYIILPSEAAYSVDDVKNDKQLKDVAAVKNGKVYAMPSAFDPWDSPVPGGIMGNYWMLNTLQGDLYSLKDLQSEVKSFYEIFYGFTPDISKISK